MGVCVCVCVCARWGRGCLLSRRRGQGGHQPPPFLPFSAQGCDWHVGCVVSGGFLLGQKHPPCLGIGKQLLVLHLGGVPLGDCSAADCQMRAVALTGWGDTSPSPPCRPGEHIRGNQGLECTERPCFVAYRMHFL